MPNDLIRYDLLVQEALCGVVKKVLGEAARDGLPGDHRFEIAFRTHAPGVRLSTRMRERFPDEILIILQHQFENLSVTDHAFEVGLSFDGIPEMVLVPFDALTGFFDPSVHFGLKFELHPEGTEEGANDTGAPRPDSASAASKASGAVSKPVGLLTKPVALPAAAASPLLPKSVSDPAKAGGETKPAGDDADENGKAKVVSIDSFRKKT